MILKLVSIILIIYSVSAISALALGGGGEDNEVTLVYSMDLSTYVLGVQNSFQYAYTGTPFTICFRERPVNNIANDTCELANQSGSYECMGVNITFEGYFATGQYRKWTLSSDLLTKSDISQYVPNHGIDAAQVFNIDVKGKVLGKDFSFLPKNETFYEVISTTTWAFDEKLYPIKTNYVNTFVGQFEIPSDNLLMQHQVLCYIYGNYVNLLFVGGVMRSGFARYMAAFISYEKSKKPFTQWVGLSFAKDKVRRDMLGVFPSTAQFDDLYSIYASAPFRDVSVNVNGTEDWTLQSSSEKINSGYAGWFYFTQLSRSYETGDNNGDQILMYKINNKFCYAAYFSSDTAVKPYYDNKNYNHQLLRCFTPDIALHAPTALFTLLLILVAFLYI